MTYPYKILSPALHSTGDAAIEWFRKNWGIKKGDIRIEVPFDDDVEYRPTMHARTNDAHILCIEVMESIYSNTLDSIVLDCREKGLPVMLYVAVQKGRSDPQYAAKLQLARRAGVGILEVNKKSGQIVQKALSLSVAGVRSIQFVRFPSRYRQSLQTAHQTFRDGDPPKACATVYDELESLCRRFAKKCVTKGLWPNKANHDLNKVPWATLMSDIDRYLDRGSPLTRNVTPALIARIIGVTPHRNETGHKPATLSQLVKRDQALRTRFESAIDLLSDFIEATKKIKP